MKRGAHSTIEYLSHRLLRRRVPKWYEAFCDPVSGGFYERLGRGFRPLLTGNRRLLTQCRQLSLYSHAAIQRKNRHFRPDLKRHFNHIVETYFAGDTAGWYFSVDDSGTPLDTTNDLYTLTFIIFSFSHYYRAAGDDRAQTLARSVLDFIRNHFKDGDRPGYVEAVDEKLEKVERVRRQNPHMHLLEACLFAVETWDDPNYLVMADEMVELFYKRFFDQKRSLLGEYYDADLGRHPEKGLIVEPGHYFEWIWLLKKHEDVHGDPGKHDEACFRLLDFANEHGWDKEHGGIYDELNADGKVIKDTKRLWPFAEALKANALMLDSGGDKDFVKDRISEMIRIFRDRYMDERGFWTEWLNRDLSPATGYMPGTTPYHVYFGVMESRDVMARRGTSKSLFLPVVLLFYSCRRSVSLLFRGLKGS